MLIHSISYSVDIKVNPEIANLKEKNNFFLAVRTMASMVFTPWREVGIARGRRATEVKRKEQGTQNTKKWMNEFRAIIKIFSQYFPSHNRKKLIYLY